MKKTYIQPTMEVVEKVTQQNLLTGSYRQLVIDSNPDDAVEEDVQLSRRQYNVWDDDDEEYDPGYTEEDIARYLKEGAFDAITRVVTANGRKKSAHSTSLSTVYDRRGLTERMQVDARDEARLKGEQTREKFIKRI